MMNDSPSAASPSNYGQQNNTMGGQSLRRRTVTDNGYSQDGYNSGGGYNTAHNSNGASNKEKTIRRKVVRKLDLFPKVEQDLMVKTERGGLITLVGYGVIFFLILSELLAHRAMNNDTSETLVVDTSLSPKMVVNLNISFPAIACVDLHLDVMDVAGDSQINIEDTLHKRKISKLGRIMGSTMDVDVNMKHKEDKSKAEILNTEVAADYCGPCYGAANEEEICCNTCDDVVNAYKEKRWNADQIMNMAEQCIREGKGSKKDYNGAPRHITTGEGCNLSGHMNINRVNGNFHVALGEGVERNGRHIHLFVPEDAPKFNTTHTIHELTFGKKVTASEHGSLDGVTKVTTDENGETGLFQYYIKVVPTVYKTKYEGVTETNRYFFTERYRPLYADGLEEEHFAMGEQRGGRVHAGHHVGGSMKDSHSKGGHHHHMNSILPGIFFIFEISPFAIVVEEKSVPFSHFLIRIMALVGGVFTIVGWTDNLMCVREKHRRR